MSQRGKRPNKPDNDHGGPAVKRRKGRPPGSGSKNHLSSSTCDDDNAYVGAKSAGSSFALAAAKAAAAAAAAAAASSSKSWQPKSQSDLKGIYNRSAPEAPAELFRKDLISAMKLPDSEPLSSDEYWLIVDQWKQEWERGVQVPVNPDALPQASVNTITESFIQRGRQDFKLPKNKYIRITKDESFSHEQHYLSHTPAIAESVCAYDLDQMDEAWLKLCNGERALAGLSTISDEQFERVVEELEVRCWDKIQAIMKNEEGLGIEFDENVICDVCRSPDSEEANEMVFCDSCNICVHQACYGITAIPSGQWLCRTCAAGIKPDCVLCPNKGGAMKSTRSGQKWAHVSCALWIPEVSIGSVDRMEPITKISNIPSSRWALNCVLCRERVGACIQCSVKTCKIAYHVTCAFQHGLEMRAIIEDEHNEDGVKLRSYCQKHSNVKSKKDGGSNSGGGGGAGNSNNNKTSAANSGTASGSEEEDTRRRKTRKEMTSEERNHARAQRMAEVEAEFDKHVNIKDISCHLLDIDQEGINYIYNYWILKRKSGNNRPLLPPKNEDSELASKKEENQEHEKMRLFVQLRQDLERVRNLCYMVSRREKLSRSFFKLREQTFHKQVAIVSDVRQATTKHHRVSDSFMSAVLEANHGPSIYDKLYSSDSVKLSEVANIDVIQERLLSSNISSSSSNSLSHSSGSSSNNNSSTKINSNKLKSPKSEPSTATSLAVSSNNLLVVGNSNLSSPHQKSVSSSSRKNLDLNGINNNNKKNLKSGASTQDTTTTNTVPGVTSPRHHTDNPYKKTYFNGTTTSRRSASLCSSSTGLSTDSAKTSSSAASSEDEQQQLQSQKKSQKSTKGNNKNCAPTPMLTSPSRITAIEKSTAASVTKSQDTTTKRRRVNKVESSKYKSASIVDSSSEEDEDRVQASVASSAQQRSRRSPRNRTLQQMEQELVKERMHLTDSTDSDELTGLCYNKTSNYAGMKVTSAIYSDSDSTDKDKTDNTHSDSQQQLFRTKAAMKEFNVHSASKPPPPQPVAEVTAASVTTKKAQQRLLKEEKRQSSLSGKSGRKTKASDFPSDLLVVPQRQAAKKASENLMRAAPVLTPTVQPSIEKLGGSVVTDDFEKKIKSSKVSRSVKVEKTQDSPLSDRERDRDRQRSEKEKDMAALELLPYVPQRQAAKKAAEHIKSAVLKPSEAPTMTPIQTAAESEKKIVTSKTSSSSKKEEPKPSSSSSESDSSSSASSNTSNSSSSSSSSSDDSEAETAPPAPSSPQKITQQQRKLSVSSSGKQQAATTASVSKRANDKAKDLPFLDKAAKSVGTVFRSSASDTDSEDSTSDSASDDDSSASASEVNKKAMPSKITKQRKSSSTTTTTTTTQAAPSKSSSSGVATTTGRPRGRPRTKSNANKDTASPPQPQHSTKASKTTPQRRQSTATAAAANISSNRRGSKTQSVEDASVSVRGRKSDTKSIFDSPPDDTSKVSTAAAAGNRRRSIGGSRRDSINASNERTTSVTTGKSQQSVSTKTKPIDSDRETKNTAENSSTTTTAAAGATPRKRRSITEPETTTTITNTTPSKSFAEKDVTTLRTSTDKTDDESSFVSPPKREAPKNEMSSSLAHFESPSRKSITPVPPHSAAESPKKIKTPVKELLKPSTPVRDTTIDRESPLHRPKSRHSDRHSSPMRHVTQSPSSPPKPMSPPPRHTPTPVKHSSPLTIKSPVVAEKHSRPASRTEVPRAQTRTSSDMEIEPPLSPQLKHQHNIEESSTQQQQQQSQSLAPPPPVPPVVTKNNGPTSIFDLTDDISEPTTHDNAFDVPPTPLSFTSHHNDWMRNDSIEDTEQATMDLVEKLRQNKQRKQAPPEPQSTPDDEVKLLSGLSDHRRPDYDPLVLQKQQQGENPPCTEQLQKSEDILKQPQDTGVVAYDRPESAIFNQQPQLPPGGKKNDLFGNQQAYVAGAQNQMFLDRRYNESEMITRRRSVSSSPASTVSDNTEQQQQQQQTAQSSISNLSHQAQSKMDVFGQPKLFNEPPQHHNLQQNLHQDASLFPPQSGAPSGGAGNWIPPPTNAVHLPRAQHPSVLFYPTTSMPSRAPGMSYSGGVGMPRMPQMGNKFEDAGMFKAPNKMGLGHLMSPGNNNITNEHMSLAEKEQLMQPTPLMSSNQNQSDTHQAHNSSNYSDCAVAAAALAASVAATIPTNTTVSIADKRPSTVSLADLKKSPTKLSRNVYRQNIENVQNLHRSPLATKSPGKSPRQMEMISRQATTKASSKMIPAADVPVKSRSRSNSTKGSGQNNKSKNRNSQKSSRGRNPLTLPLENFDFGGTNHSSLAGTVYDLDLEEDNYGAPSMPLFRTTVRDRRKSHDNREQHDYLRSRGPSESPKFSSPKNRSLYSSAANTPNATPNAAASTTPLHHNLSLMSPEATTPAASVPPSTTTSLHDTLLPVLPGPVDMRTYNSTFDSSASDAFNNHLLGAFESGTADHTLQDIDEDVENELHLALKASNSKSLPDPAPEPPKSDSVTSVISQSTTTTTSNAASTAHPAEPPSEDVSVDSDSIKVSIPDARNQLKLKIKGPLAPDGYASSQKPVETTLSVTMASTMPTGSSGGLRRMRKKELLQRYWMHDANVDDQQTTSESNQSVPYTAPSRVAGIPKAVDSMSSIPTKDDYKDYTATDNKKRKKVTGLQRELRQLSGSLDEDGTERRRSIGNASDKSSNASTSGARGRARNSAAAGGVTPKLKIKIGTDYIEPSVVSAETETRPPKKRPENINVNYTLEDLKRDSMNFRKEVFADFGKKAKLERVEKAVKEKKKKKKDKKRKVEVIENNQKFVLKIKKPKLDESAQPQPPPQPTNETLVAPIKLSIKLSKTTGTSYQLASKGKDKAKKKPSSKKALKAAEKKSANTATNETNALKKHDMSNFRLEIPKLDEKTIQKLTEHPSLAVASLSSPSTSSKLKHADSLENLLSGDVESLSTDNSKDPPSKSSTVPPKNANKGSNDSKNSQQQSSGSQKDCEVR